MKKLISIALFTAVFGLVGCATQKDPDMTAERDYNVAGASSRPKCPPKGKLGAVRTKKDIHK